MFEVSMIFMPCSVRFYWNWTLHKPIVFLWYY